jgi:hypothetical protein
VNNTEGAAEKKSKIFREMNNDRIQTASLVMQKNS